jgi:hypothetical protein
VSEVALHQALHELVPDCSDASGNWDDVLRRSGIANAAPEARAARWTARRLIPVALVAAIVALLVAPGLGIGGRLLDLIGRTDVPFTGAKSAPVDVKREFFDLSLGVPPEMGPQAIVSQARRVGVFRARGRTYVLHVAPTRGGGYCWTFTGALLGCHPTRPVSRPLGRSERGAVAPHRLGVSWMGTPIRLTRQGVPTAADPPYVRLVMGDLRARNADVVQVEYEDGATTDIPFVYVSKPIDAGFFVYGIPKGHERPGSRASAVQVLDAEGRVLARQPITYPTARDFPRRLPRNAKPHVPRTPPVPPPTPPLRRAEAGGVVVTIGSNGVAVFDKSNADQHVEFLIGPRATYSCFSFMRYHRDAPAAMGFWRDWQPRVAIRALGLRTPFDGCDIRAGHGHVWPDRNGSHSAVEVAFTARGERYFLDRAAARDLALFVRSDEMHRIRKLTGAPLRAAFRQRYGAALAELRTPTEPLRAKRIGYVVRADGVTFVERSETGRLFSVVVRRGKIVRQNVKPLGFVF